MRRMSPRQAIIIVAYCTLLFVLSACFTRNDILPTQTVTSSPQPTATITQTPSPLPPTATFTSTPFECLNQPGLVNQDVVSTTNPPQEFLIYLPPCYTNLPNVRFPVLYLLHGQTYTDDQWVRLGVPTVADQLINSKAVVPFIIVFPDDRFWNIQAGPGFGERLIYALIPYVDQNYRTIADRDQRSLGGLSRGGGWAVEVGFSHPDLFGSLGLHSPAIFRENAPIIEKTIKAIPETERPRLWLDAGDADRELMSIMDFESLLSSLGYIHEFHIYNGDHTESYWSAHVEEYLRWYAEAWQVIE